MLKLTNKAYDEIKFWVTTVSPALIALITAVGAIFKMDLTAFTGLIAAVTAFVGTVLGISSANYHKEQEDERNRI